MRGCRYNENNTMNFPQHPTRTVGKYLISPLTQAAENGWYACSVSIRSGRGSGTTDRVVRLEQRFRDRATAADHAMAEGLQWVGAPAAAAMAA